MKVFSFPKSLSVRYLFGSLKKDLGPYRALRCLSKQGAAGAAPFGVSFGGKGAEKRLTPPSCRGRGAS